MDPSSSSVSSPPIGEIPTALISTTLTGSDSLLPANFWAQDALHRLQLSLVYGALFSAAILNFYLRRWVPSDVKSARDFSYFLVFHPLCCILIVLAAMRCIFWNAVPIVYNVDGNRDPNFNGASDSEPPFTMSDFEWRWFHSNSWDVHASALYVGMQLYSLAVCIYLNPLHDLPIFLHHVFSVYCQGLALLTSRTCYFASLSLLCEVTNIPLNILYICQAEAKAVPVEDKSEKSEKSSSGEKEKDGVCKADPAVDQSKDTKCDEKPAKEKKKKQICKFASDFRENYPRLYLLNGFFLAASFVPFRLILFPFYLYQQIYDVWWHLPECRELVNGHAAAGVTVSESDIDKVQHLQCQRDIYLWDTYYTSLELWSSLTLLSAIMVLSFIWFPIIVKGFFANLKKYNLRLKEEAAAGKTKKAA